MTASTNFPSSVHVSSSQSERARQNMRRAAEVAAGSVSRRTEKPTALPSLIPFLASFGVQLNPLPSFRHDAQGTEGARSSASPLLNAIAIYLAFQAVIVLAGWIAFVNQ